MDLFVNIDVDDLSKAIAFYQQRKRSVRSACR
jgi:hypothetical protein